MMGDVVVTVPKELWQEWLGEGDAAGEPATGIEYLYWLPRYQPLIIPGERIYIVAHDRLRGYAPLARIHKQDGRVALLRRGGAVAVTIDERIPGFRGFRYRWWRREIEMPFPEWRTP